MIVKSIVGVIAITVSFSVVAAKPLQIITGSKGVADNGEKYHNYVALCNNGKRFPLTYWKKRRQWCVGSQSLDSCSKKSIEAARGACKKKNFSR